jgi:hemerythrin-like domain-containing protein
MGKPQKVELSRRRLLLGGAAAAATAAATGWTGTADAAAKTPARGATADLAQIPATENLMREHGVLKRVLLAYNEIGRRITAKQPVPAGVVAEAATVIHDYIEGFHEALEEGYVFPRLRRAGVLVPTVDTLLTQHARGRMLTQAILTQSTTAGLSKAATTTQIASYMALFVRMYEPHEAREDTVVFPAYRALLSDAELEEMAGLLSSDQTSQFGRNGFADTVAQVARIETKLGIAELDQFTPPATS